MNKRVEELAHQAGLDSFYVPEWSPWAEEFEKFAELVVRECINIVNDAVDHREPASTYVGKIKEHFGVEE